MRMCIFKGVPQRQEAYLVQREVFFFSAVVGEGGGYPPTCLSSFKMEVSPSKYC